MASLTSKRYHDSVQCTGVDEEEDDAPCQETLLFEDVGDYCDNCGLEITQALFEIAEQLDICQGKDGTCKAKLIESKKRCKKCGTKNPLFEKVEKGDDQENKHQPDTSLDEEENPMSYSHPLPNLKENTTDQETEDKLTETVLCKKSGEQTPLSKDKEPTDKCQGVEDKSCGEPLSLTDKTCGACGAPNPLFSKRKPSEKCQGTDDKPCGGPLSHRDKTCNTCGAINPLFLEQEHSDECQGVDDKPCGEPLSYTDKSCVACGAINPMFQEREPLGTLSTDECQGVDDKPCGEPLSYTDKSCIACGAPNPLFQKREPLDECQGVDDKPCGEPLSYTDKSCIACGAPNPLFQKREPLDKCQGTDDSTCGEPLSIKDETCSACGASNPLFQKREHSKECQGVDGNPCGELLSFTYKSCTACGATNPLFKEQEHSDKCQGTNDTTCGEPLSQKDETCIACGASNPLFQKREHLEECQGVDGKPCGEPLSYTDKSCIACGVQNPLFKKQEPSDSGKKQAQAGYIKEGKSNKQTIKQATDADQISKVTTKVLGENQSFDKNKDRKLDMNNPTMQTATTLNKADDGKHLDSIDIESEYDVVDKSSITELDENKKQLKMQESITNETFTSRIEDNNLQTNGDQQMQQKNDAYNRGIAESASKVDPAPSASPHQIPTEVSGQTQERKSGTGPTTRSKNTQPISNVKGNKNPKPKSGFREITFYIIVPPEFEIEKKDVVQLVFSGGPSTTYMLNRQRTVNDGFESFHLYSGKLNLDRHWLTTSKYLSYKYQVKRVHQNEPESEYLNEKKRYLEWHEDLKEVYDGVMNTKQDAKKKEGLGKMVDIAKNYMGLKKNLSSKDKRLADLHFSLKTYLQSPKVVARDTNNSFEKNNVVIRSLFETYSILISDLKEVQIKHMVAAVLIEHLQEINKKERESKQESMERMTFVLFTILSTKSLLDKSQLETVFQAVLIRPDSKKRECPDYNGMMKVFQSEKTLLNSAMTALLELCVHNCEMNPDLPWMYALPVIHFYFDGVTPFKKLESDYKGHATLAWWGLHHLGDHPVNVFKSITHIEMLQNRLENLKPLFAADYLLERTFIASCKMEEVKRLMKICQFEPTVILANLCYFSKCGITTKHADFFDIYNSVLETISSAKDEEINLKGSLYMNNSVRIRIIEREGHWYNKHVLLQLYKCSFALVSRLNGKQMIEEQYIHKITLECIDFLCAKAPPSSKENIQLWNEVFTMQLGNIEGLVFSLTTNKLKEALKQLNNLVLVEVYCQLSDTFCQHIQQSFDEAVFKDIESVLKVYELQRKNYWSTGSLEKYGKFLSQKFLEKKRAFINTTSKQYLMCLEWQPGKWYLKHLDELKKGVVSRECQENLEESRRQLLSLKGNLESGEITLDEFQSLIEHCPTFCELVAASEKDEANLRALFERRKTERNMLDRETKCVDLLLQRFTEINRDSTIPKVQLNETERRNRRLKNEEINEIKFVDFCSIDGGCYIHYYQFTDDMTDVIDTVLDRHESWTFQKMWVDVGKTYFKDQEISSSFDKASTVVFERLEQKWQSMIKNIKSNEVTIQEAKDIFGCSFDEMDINKELRNMGIHSDIAACFAAALTKFNDMERSVKVTNTLLEVLCSLEDIENPFSEFVYLANKVTENADISLKEFLASDRPSIPDVILTVKEIQYESIKVYNDCQDMVSWIKENVGDKNTWRVFVELASIHAGESAADMARIRCFDSAVTGYSPLIFGLEECKTFDEVYNQCSILWKALESDTLLPEKMKDVSVNHKWYEHIQENIGSDEVLCMDKAKQINENGIYCVGCLSDTKLRIADKPEFDLVNILRLTIPHVNAEEVKYYTYEELQNLQSRLMLVAGNEQDVKEATKAVFDSVVRLANVYKKLCHTGCVLFKKWKAQILCDPLRPVCVYLEFGKGFDKLGWKCEDDKDVSYVTPKLAKFMERCLDKWTAYIDKERTASSYLNFYTMDQLVILQNELVHVGLSEDEEPSVKTYPLLSFLKRDCSKEDILQAMKNAIDILKKDNRTMNQGYESNRSDEQDCDINMDIVKEITDNGYSKMTALRAIQTCGNDMDILDLLEWANDHDEQIREEEKEALKFKGWCKSACSGAKHTAKVYSFSENTNPTVEDLDKIWDSFITSFESTVVDFISLKHMSLILQQLAKLETSTAQRKSSPAMTPGQPHLLTCQEDHVLKTTLQMYMHDKKQPLPFPEEVLLCTKTTTIDQVDIFLRRALFDDSGKIHCLVEPEMLSFAVDDTCERQLEKYMLESKDKDLKYRFIVVSSSSKQSRILSALEKYSQKLKTESDDDESLRRYIKDKLTFSSPDKRICAAKSDSESCSVRMIKSSTSGQGKTLLSKRIIEQFTSQCTGSATEMSNIIPIQESDIDENDIATQLLDFCRHPNDKTSRIICIDISPLAETGIDNLLFNLCILGVLMDSQGFIWRKREGDLYLIEATVYNEPDGQKRDELNGKTMYSLLPDVWCKSPNDCLSLHSKSEGQCFDEQQFRSELFQTPIQYIVGLDEQKLGQRVPTGDAYKSLEILLKHCGIENPSWAELTQYAKFLGTQLRDFESSIYCNDELTSLPKFSEFVLKFLLQMSKDFSTKSLTISEDTNTYDMKRTWESSPHPYIFFNPDQTTMTFLGFNINRTTLNLEDATTGEVMTTNIVSKQLMYALEANQVPINDNFEALSRYEKLQRICRVMGVDNFKDPDDTYELTTDNSKKILAIYMRLRCDIPVVVMGETGSGKTRLVSFMCMLQLSVDDTSPCMVISKIHGGTKPADIIKKVEQTEQLAKSNQELYKDRPVYTVLFLDEANSTDCIGLIKEIMCDKSIQGRPIQMANNLRIVAACNPYRKHSEELVKRMEEAGLGYHVDSDKATDRFGDTPMRRLVYRVKRLPMSLIPLVWDFGQLDAQTEKLYIKQLVRQYVRKGRLPDENYFVDIATEILSGSQEFMRTQKDECSFVSLRDVDRTLTVMEWFYQISQRDDNILIKEIDHKLEEMQIDYQNMIDREEVTYDMVYDEDDLLETSDAESDGSTEFDVEDVENSATETLKIKQRPNRKLAVKDFQLKPITRCLVLALGVCYHSGLRVRDKYRQKISKYFKKPFPLPGRAKQFENELKACQEVFLDNVTLDRNIAKNHALRENLFMMVVCIELRIPLFLIGKPGSSKSLAKAIVSDAMRGPSSEKAFFRDLKQIQMVSYQCSPQSTADGIIALFKQCADFQVDKDLSSYTSVVVLDEVGLAEDSPRMPLKSLHAMLETGYQEDDSNVFQKYNPYSKVGFIGISNWALDPAKMNRGIMVQRDLPDHEELEETARGICAADPRHVSKLFSGLARAYSDIVDKPGIKREFFGLRDFYSLIKMIQAFAIDNRGVPTQSQMKHAVLRNFGGIDSMDPFEIFIPYVKAHLSPSKKVGHEPDCTPAGMIQQSLRTIGRAKGQSRYLLLLTENLSMISLLKQRVFKLDSATTIYGSSFPNDLDFTQVCRNVNKIKICMETGTTVILLNLENIYESLYDALNQYYSSYGTDRFVDIGLGSHRTKCRVHKQFRLIVVSEKTTVYEKYPIPLINRLEKHFVKIDTLLLPPQISVANQLQAWAEDFCQNTTSLSCQFVVKDVFRGFHDDACAAIVLFLWEKQSDDDQACVDESIEEENVQTGLEQDVLTQGKHLLLWCATPEAIVRTNMCKLSKEENKKVWDTYWTEQSHENLSQYIKTYETNDKPMLCQITTHSKLLSSTDKVELSRECGIDKDFIFLDSLEAFDTEQQFNLKIRSYIDLCREQERRSLLVVMCEYAYSNANLIACARNCLTDECVAYANSLKLFNVIFLVRLARDGKTEGSRAFTGLQCGQWCSLHIDNIRHSDTPLLPNMTGRSVGELLTDVKLSLTEQEQAQGSKDDKDLVARMDIFLRNILTKCVTFAMSRVTYPQDSSKRSLEMIEFLLKLLNAADGNMQFSNCLSDLLTAFLLVVEKEFGNPDTLSEWTYNVACNKDAAILKAGTYRDACMKHIQEKIEPVLADIIAYVDRNQNLDILQSDISSWKQIFWLDILSSKDLLNLHTSDMLCFKQSMVKNEVTVRKSGFEGQMFQAKFPFSWLLFDKINSFITDVAKEETQTSVNVDKAEELLAQTALGRLIQHHGEENAEDMIRSYTEDVLHMITTCTCDSECQVLMYIVWEQGKLDWKEQNKSSPVKKLVIVHETVKKLQSSFTILRAAGQIVKGYTNGRCDELYMKWKQVSSDTKYIGVGFLMISLLELIMHEVSPTSPEKLKTSQGQKDYIKKVYTCRQVVEQIFTDYIDAGVEEVTNGCRREWTRIMIVKLFIEHVCLSEAYDGQNSNMCSILWTSLKQPNLKEKKSIEALEKFLKMCNQDMLKSLFGNFEKCDRCGTERKKVESMVPLACGHLICSKCLTEIKTTDMGDCPKCGKKIDSKYDQNKCDSSGDANLKLKQYSLFRRKCNSFYMDVVTQMCFSNDGEPEDAVVHHLLNLVINDREKESVVEIRIRKDLTVAVESVDSNPVFKSFMLKLLVRTNVRAVEMYLEDVLPNIKDTTEVLQLNVITVQCFEDVFFEESMKQNELKYTIKKLRKLSLVGTAENVELINNLAKIRFALGVLSKYIHSEYINSAQQASETSISDIEELIGAVLEAIQEGTEMPRIYLLKQIFRRYGDEALRKFCRSDHELLSRLCPKQDLKTDDESMDRYAIFDETYTTYRDAIMDAKRSLDESTLQHLKYESPLQLVLMCLAIHREITMKRIDNDEEDLKEVIGLIGAHLEKGNMLSDLNRRLLENTISPEQGLLKAGPHMDKMMQDVHGLVVHCICVFQNINTDKNCIMQPFTELAITPGEYKDSFLPAMPQSDATLLEELRKIVEEGSKADVYHTPKLYSCPNGHPFVIGDCGRAVETVQCPSCGVNIGGKSHSLLESCTTGLARETGHRLQMPGSVVLEPLRTLSAPVAGMMRFLTHIAMYIGTMVDSETIQSMIKVKVDWEKCPIQTFLYEHMCNDVDSIGEALSRNKDDVLLLMHFVVQRILEIVNDDYVWKSGDSKMTKAETRDVWEQDLNQKLFHPIVFDVDTKVQSGLKSIAKDQRFASETFDKILEVYKHDEDEQIMRLQDQPAIWQYRTRISVAHMRDAFFNAAKSSPADEQVVLLEFLKKESHLRCLKYIPSIRRLHRLLLQQYNKNLDRKQAEQITVGDLRLEDTAEKQYMVLIEQFKQAWNKCRDSLSQKPYLTKKKQQHLPRELCDLEINDQTSLSMFLPSQEGKGLCSFGLLQFLYMQHNEMIEFLRNNRRSTGVHAVSMNDVSASDLIIFDSERDLLPLVLANCQYSFEIGKGTSIEYDFENIERQIVDRYMFSKPTVRFSRSDLSKAEEMVYRFDTTNASIFQSLQKLIKQESIDETSKHQINQEFKFYVDICRSLENLNTAINFLKSLGANNPNEFLVVFMENTLKLENTLTSSRAQQYCRLKHVKSLWLLLSRRKAMEYMAPNHSVMEVFDGIAKGGVFDEIDKHTSSVLSDYYEDMSPESLQTMSEIIFESIVMRFSESETSDGEEGVDYRTISLRDALMYDEQIGDMYPHMASILEKFPEGIICNQSGHACVIAFNQLNETT